MDKEIIYHVSIEVTEKQNVFRIRWTDSQQKDYVFEQSAAKIMPEEMEWMWKDRRNQQQIGKKLFCFLDGKEGHLSQALNESHRCDRDLILHLTTCNEMLNWPFELLALEDSFLLPDRLHLVRYISNGETVTEFKPQDRPLRLLFMACVPIDVDQELDFEKEEEAVFNITAGLAVDMEVEDTGSLEGLRSKLEERQYDIIHLSGYAGVDKSEGPFFIMETATGYGELVSAKKLWEEALSINPPRMLFISGNGTGDTPEKAESALARSLVEVYHIPTVLGWGQWISDMEANDAAVMIYKELSRGESIVHAIQRARYDLNRRFSTVLKPSWPQLRLFSSGPAINAIVEKEQKRRLQPRRMKHVYLKNSQVKVLLEGFVGRRRQLQQSFRVLTQESKKFGILILGTGGLGKSCLAGKVIERFKDHTLITVHGILNSITLKQALKDSFIAAQDDDGKMILTWQKEMKDILGALGALCRSSFRDKKYLILFDDFEQNLEESKIGEPFKLFPETEKLLNALLVCLSETGKSTQMVITCRYEFSMIVDDRDFVNQHLQKIWLTGFRETERKKKARELPNIAKQEEQSTAVKLLAAGCGNPRLMEWMDILVGELKKVEIPKLAEALQGKKEEFIREHVIRKLLNKGGADLTRFLQWFSVYRKPVFIEGAEVIGLKAKLKNWNNLLHRGMALSLIEHDQARAGYQGSPLLREELLKKSDDIHACHEAAFAYYKKICDDIPEERFDPLPVEEWIYHALACGEDNVAVREGGKLVNYLNESMAFLESLRAGTSILAEKKGTSPTTYDASLLNSLAYTLEDLGEPAKAAGLYQKALTIDEELLGEDHPNVAIRLNNLGSVYKSLGDYEKARDYFEKAKETWKRIPGEKNQDMACTLNNLGTVWQELADYKKAIAYYQDALDIDVAVYGRKHPNVATRLTNLGESWKRLGYIEKAIDYYKEALEIDKNFYGQEHYKISIRLNNLGEAWRLKGEPTKAIGYYREALTINTVVYEEDHPQVALSLNNLGSTWIELNDCPTAVTYLEKALRIFKDTYGEKHQNVSSVLNNLGLAWKEIGDLKKAVEYLQEAYDIDKELFGNKHPRLATGLSNLGSLWMDLGDYQNAIKNFKEAMGIDNEAFGPNHPNVALSMSCLGTVYGKLGQNEKAIVLCKAALSIWQKVYGEKHPLIASGLNNLGSIWENLGDHQKAIDYYRQALSMDKSIYGYHHSNTAARLNNIGSALKGMGDYTQAIDYYRQALEIDIEVNGLEHPYTARDMHNLGTVYFKLGQTDAAEKHITTAYEIFENSYGKEAPDTKAVGVWLEKLKKGK